MHNEATASKPTAAVKSISRTRSGIAASSFAFSCGTEAFCADVFNNGLIRPRTAAKSDFWSTVHNGTDGTIRASNGGEVDFHSLVNNSGCIASVDCNSTIDFCAVSSTIAASSAPNTMATLISTTSSRTTTRSRPYPAVTSTSTVTSPISHDGLILASGCDSGIGFYCGTVGNHGTINATNDGGIDFHNGVNNYVIDRGHIWRVDEFP